MRELVANQREGREHQHARSRAGRAEERQERRRQADLRGQAKVDREIAATERDIARQRAEEARTDVREERLGR